MIKGVHHTGISVPDLDAAVRFYCEVLGFRESARDSWADSTDDDAIMGLHDSAGEYALLRLGSSYLELIAFRRPPGTAKVLRGSVADHGLTHLCLLVDSAQDEYERLSSAGVLFFSGPRPNGGPPDDGGGLCAYGQDPFGNVFEILECTQGPGPALASEWAS